jgi:hypothetical protein
MLIRPTETEKTTDLGVGEEEGPSHGVALITSTKNKPSTTAFNRTKCAQNKKKRSLGCNTEESQGGALEITEEVTRKRGKEEREGDE